MAGVRISGIPKKVEEKLIKIHFSKPQNGGGTIKKIYYPLHNNDAVIIFYDPAAVDTLLQNEYASTMGRERYHVVIRRLPEHTVFSSMQARVSPDASVLLQTSSALLDEFRYTEDIEVDFDEKTGSYVLTGNWYQLEWAWSYLDAFIEQQEIIQDEIRHKPFRNNASPMDVEDGGGNEFGASVRVGLNERKEDTKSAFYTERVASGKTERGRMTAAQSLTHSVTKLGEKSGRDNISSPDSRHESRQAWTRNYKPLSSPTSSDEDDNDELDLSGRGYEIPDESIPASLHSTARGRKTDQDKTFDQFSGLDLEADKTAKHRDILDKHQLTKRFEQDRSTAGLKSYKTDQTGTHRTDDLSAYRDEDSSLSRSDQKFMSLPADIERSRDSKQSRGSPAKTGATDFSKQKKEKTLGETYSTDHTDYRFTINEIDVVVLCGDLVQQDTDAIVNPANSSLEHWGGASYAISRAAGSSLDRECREYIAKNGTLKVADVMSTTAGNLKASCVLHTNGPMWFEGSRKDKVEYELSSTFLNCFHYAEKLRLKSLCVPAISTGVFGVPLDICVRSFLGAILIFSEQRTSKNLQNISFINRDPEATVTTIVLLQTALESDLEELSSQAFEAYNRFKDKEIDIPKGRQERLGDYERDMAKKTSFSSSLYQRSPTASLSTESTTKTPRRSSSLSRLSQRSPTENKKEESHQAVSKRSSFLDTESSLDSRLRSSSNSRMEPKRGASESNYLSQSSADRKGKSSRIDQRSSGDPDASGLSDKKTWSTSSLGEGNERKDYETGLSAKYTTSVGASLKSEKDMFARTTPSLKQSLLTKTTDYKLKGAVKNAGTGSPTGKVRARRVDDEEDLSEEDYKTEVKHTSSRTQKERQPTEYDLHRLPANLNRNSRVSESPLTAEEAEKCAICLEVCKKPKALQTCKHTFCGRCIDAYFKKVKPACPVCGTIYGKVRGTQPKDGKMIDGVKHNVFLPGYENADGAIVIKYDFPSGMQQSNHPNPGKPYKGISRTAYLPNDREGRQILSLLRRAFDARLVFTVGASRTTGKEGVLTWNDIHHKTNIFGGPENFGYPDPTYLSRVRQELADKGITTE